VCEVHTCASPAPAIKCGQITWHSVVGARAEKFKLIYFWQLALIRCDLLPVGLSERAGGRANERASERTAAALNYWRGRNFPLFSHTRKCVIRSPNVHFEHFLVVTPRKVTLSLALFRRRGDLWLKWRTALLKIIQSSLLISPPRGLG